MNGSGSPAVGMTPVVIAMFIIADGARTVDLTRPGHAALSTTEMGMRIADLAATIEPQPAAKETH